RRRGGRDHRQLRQDGALIIRLLCLLSLLFTAAHGRARPPGRGLWIWKFAGVAPQKVAERAAQLGVGFVLIKSGEDDFVDEDNFNQATVAAFTKLDIEVFAWVYVRPTVPG